MASISNQPHYNECPMCEGLIDDHRPGGAIDHAVANLVSHHFHISCVRGLADIRHAQGLEITCPLDNCRASGITGIPFAPPPPLDELPLQALMLVPNFEAFAEVAFNGLDIDVIAPAAFLHIPQEGALLAMAAFNGDLNSVQAAIANGNISNEVHLLALKGASAGGHLNIVQTLLNNRIISDKARGSAVIFAARHRRLDVIQELLTNGYITRKDRGEAVVNASKEGHLDVVLALMAKRNISDGDHRFALISASIYGHLDVVQALLANRNISEATRTTALLDALKREHLDVFQALLANGNILLDGITRSRLARMVISENTRRQARQIACQNGRYDLASLLKKKPSFWSPIIIGSAIAALAWVVNEVFFNPEAPFFL